MEHTAYLQKKHPLFPCLLPFHLIIVKQINVSFLLLSFDRLYSKRSKLKCFHLQSNFENIFKMLYNLLHDKKKMDLDLVFSEKPAKWWLHWIYLAHFWGLLYCYRGVIQKRRLLLPSTGSSCLQQIKELPSAGS